MMRVYISGPISGIEDLNRPAFDGMAKRLAALGCEPVNPFDNCVPSEAPWSEHMRADIAMMMGCQAIVMLDGWKNSRGAMIEREIADSLGFAVLQVQDPAA